MKVRRPRRLTAAIVAASCAVVAMGVGVLVLNLRDEAPLSPDDASAAAIAGQIERGAYLALAGNCAACHTARGGEPYAGGRAIDTPFGSVFGSNLTPDLATGIGTWTRAHFWRAMHNGRSRDGRLLVPAFPYPHFTQITREDSDALHAYLRSLPPVRQANRAHALRFPFQAQVSLAVWRALFFRPGVYEPDAGQSDEWNRGAYLVRGLAHCGACHGGRNVLGATSESPELSGGLLPMQNWYAPALNAAHEAGVADWETAHVVELLATGRSPRGSTLGPMAEVVFRSTQYLSGADLQAIAVYLKDLPQAPVRSVAAATQPADDQIADGRRLYEDHCAGCHGNEGQGAEGAYPALAGNRAVRAETPANLVRVLVSGGYLPATAGNPRPYGMPPFGQVLDDAQIAAVASFIRGSWGNSAEPVSRLDVMRYR